MIGFKMKAAGNNRRRRRSGWLHLRRLAMPLQMLLVAVAVVMATVTGMARAEFHQPYYHNGFGFDSQLPLMPPNNPLEDHLLAAAGRGSSNVDSVLINAAANTAWGNGGNGGGLEEVPGPVNYSSSSAGYSFYINRKEVLMPLIADLIRFHNLNHEVYEAYVLNVDQQMDRNGSRNDTAGGGVVVTSVVIDTSGGSSAVASGVASAGAAGSSSQEHLEHLLLNDLSLFDLTAAADGEGTMSVLEQNLADLNDYCDNNNREPESTNNNAYHSFNNLSYNLIPKDLLEATDLFWSSSATGAHQLVIGGVGRQAPQGAREDAELRTRPNDGDDDPEDKKYLEYINKEAEDGVEEESHEEVDPDALKNEFVEEKDGKAEGEGEEQEERLDLDNNDDNKQQNETEFEEKVTEGSTITTVKEESEEQGIIIKSEHFEESDWIEELSEDSDEVYEDHDREEQQQVEVKIEEHEERFTISEPEEEELKPFIFNVLDQEEDQHQFRDWFLNGNEVISARRSRSSTLDDIDIDEFTDEDSDLVDVLLKQDVDLGFSLILPDATTTTTAITAKTADATGIAGKTPAGGKIGKSAATEKKPFYSNGCGATDDTEDDIQKWNALLEIKSDEVPSENTKDNCDEDGLPILGSDASALWNIDAETGEYIQNLPLQLDDTLIADPRRHLAELAEQEKAEDLENEELIQSLDALLFNSNEADDAKLQACERDQDCELGAVGATDSGVLEAAKQELLDDSLDEDDFYANELKDFLDDMMIQTPNMPFQHPRAVMPNYAAHSANNLFQSPYYHHHPHHHHHHPHHHHKYRVRAMDHQPPPQPVVATSPPGLGEVARSVEGDLSPPGPQHHQQYHYQCNMSHHHRWPDFATFMNYPTTSVTVAVSPAPHPGFATFSGSASGMMMGSAAAVAAAEAYHSYHHHQPHYAPNFSSAVSSSIHLTNSSSDSENGTASTYKMEHDLALYSNTSSELNMTSDGFLNSILNDEDLHLMDIGAHEGMYPMRMLDSNATNNSTASSMMSGPGVSSMLGLGAASLPVGGASGVIGSLGDMAAHGDRMEASSDSAVSSMASEPMSSLSDGEWGDTGSDSAQEYSQKYAAHHHHNGHQGGGAGAYGAAGGDASASARQSTSIAQKKHHMFGKRYFQEQNSTTANGGPKTGLHQHHPHNLVPGSLKYDYSAYENYHGHPNAALHQNGHHLSIGAAVPQLPPPPPPPPHHHHQLTVDNMKTYQADLNRGLHDIKYSCSPDFAYHQQQQQQQHQPQLHPPQPTPRMINEYLHHNHTYPMPPQNSGAVPKPPARDKKRSAAAARAVQEQEEQIAEHNRSMAEHITRDEKRAKALGIPIIVQDIINLPMDEFNERLSKYELSETQLSLIRDIRRRGKNKVAAQNCRKRKLDQIMSLADEVKGVKKQKDELMSDRNMQLNKQKKIKERFTALYRHVFQYLRDPDGNLYSSSQYSLQQSADGSVYLLPRDRKPNGGGSSGGSHMNPDYGRSQNHTQDG